MILISKTIPMVNVTSALLPMAMNRFFGKSIIMIKTLSLLRKTRAIQR